MLHFNKIDGSTLLVVLFTSVLSLVAACILPSGPAGAPNVVPLATVSSVRITLVQSTLAPGQTTQGTVVAESAAGNLISGQTVTWASVSPTVATVSSTGAVTAVASGSATIQATVSGMAGSTSLTVTQVPAPDTLTGLVPPNLSFHDFNDGAAGPYAHTADVDFPDDPTGSGRGKVARMFYNPTQDLLQSSNDEYIAYDAGATHLRYGATIWMKGEFYTPYPGTAVKAGHRRKLIDFWGGGVRMTLYRADAYSGQLRLWLSCVDWMNGSSQETVTEVTGINLADDTWYTIEVKMVTNSADNIRDGVVEIYINGAASPSYTRNTGLGWITEKYSGGSYFNYYRAGEQLTSDAGHPLYTEYRYWDNVGFSTSRIGR